MSLLKLWNSIRGRSATETATPIVAEKNDTENESLPVPSAQPSRSSKSVLRVFGSSNPYAALCKKLRSLKAAKVLEIGVGDGTRAIEVLRTLAKLNPEIRYIAVDQFEMAGGETTLKQFHQTLRTENIRPQVFPESAERGLTRVAHTIGLVDLILVSHDAWQATDLAMLLTRVSHAETLVMYHNGDAWQQYQAESVSRRAA